MISIRKLILGIDQKCPISLLMLPTINALVIHPNLWDKILKLHRIKKIKKALLLPPPGKLALLERLAVAKLKWSLKVASSRKMHLINWRKLKRNLALLRTAIFKNFRVWRNHYLDFLVKRLFRSISKFCQNISGLNSSIKRQFITLESELAQGKMTLKEDTSGESTSK